MKEHGNLTAEHQRSPVHFGDVVQPILLGMGIMLAGTIPRNILFAANLNYYRSLPWAAPFALVYLFFFGKYLGGWGDPHSTARL